MHCFGESDLPVTTGVLAELERCVIFTFKQHIWQGVRQQARTEGDHLAKALFTDVFSFSLLTFLPSESLAREKTGCRESNEEEGKTQVPLQLRSSRKMPLRLELKSQFSVGSRWEMEGSSVQVGVLKVKKVGTDSCFT